jgi:aspartate oxidase
LGREGGHTENRIVHHKDITGFEIERALIEKASQSANIEIWIIITSSICSHNTMFRKRMGF